MFLFSDKAVEYCLVFLFIAVYRSVSIISLMVVVPALQ